MKRRTTKALSLLFASASILALLAGCGGGGGTAENSNSPAPSDSSAPSGETTYADTIVIGDNTEPKNLDPDQSWAPPRPGSAPSSMRAWSGRTRTAASFPCWPPTGLSATTA